MPRRIQTPDGKVHLFPDDATDAQIQEALSGYQSPSAAPPSRSTLDTALSLLPAAGGTVGGILGGAGGAAFGLGFGGVPGAVGGAGLGGAAGEALRQLAERIMGHEHGVPDSASAAAMYIGKEGALQGGLEAAGGAASKYVVQPAAKAVMRGYLKPSLAGVKIDKARQIVQTALDEALPVTKAGEQRAERLIADINKQVNGYLSRVKGKIDLRSVADRVRSFAKAKYFKPGVDDADYQAALAVADTIDSHASLATPTGKVTKVNAPTANQIKQDVRPASRAYGQQGYSPEVTTRKVAGSEMRQEIERTAAAEGITDVGALNAREGRLIDAQDAVKHAAGREENRNALFGMPTLLAGTIGAGEGIRQRDPASGIATALAIRLALSPAMMTRAAILASKLAKNGYLPAAAARIAVEMVQSEPEQEGERHPQSP